MPKIPTLFALCALAAMPAHAPERGGEWWDGPPMRDCRHALWAPAWRLHTPSGRMVRYECTGLWLHPVIQREASPPKARDIIAIRKHRECSHGSGFDRSLDRLTAFGIDAAAALRSGDHVRARTIQACADHEWDATDAGIRSPDELALVAIGAIAPTDRRPVAVARRNVCMHLIAAGLRDRHRWSRAGGGRAGLDHLVHRALDGLATNPEVARRLGRVLARGSYLALTHEARILDLAAASVRAPFLVPIAASLLRSLWRNLERSGARTTTDLDRLALLWKDADNPSRRLAALYRLLESRNHQRRRMAVDEVLKHRDRHLARAIGVAAARWIAPDHALATLVRLWPLAGDGLLPAAVLLGERNPSLLRPGGQVTPLRPLLNRALELFQAPEIHGTKGESPG